MKIGTLMLAACAVLFSVVLFGAKSAGLIWEGDNGIAHVIWRKDNLVIESMHPVLKKTYDWHETMLKEARDNGVTSQDIVDHSLNVQSMVGPWVSFKEASYWMSPGAAHPGAFTEFRVVDAQHPDQPVSLLAWFNDADVLIALESDSFIKAHLGRDHPAFHHTSELIQYLNENGDDCQVYFDKELLSHFAFYKRAGDMVAVRIGLSHGCEVMRGQFTELGLWLPIQPEARKWFNQPGNIYMSQLVPKTDQASSDFHLGPAD